MRYKQTENFRITGPGLPEQGVVSVGPAELEAAFMAGRSEGHGAFCCCDECEAEAWRSAK